MITEAEFSSAAPAFVARAEAGEHFDIVLASGKVIELVPGSGEPVSE